MGAGKLEGNAHGLRVGLFINFHLNSLPDDTVRFREIYDVQFLVEPVTAKR